MNKHHIVYILTVIALIMSSIILSSCNNNKKASQNNNSSEKKNELTQITDSSPCLFISDVNGKPGETIEVFVEVRNNPGIFGMDFDLYFDDHVLTLIDASSEILVDGCYYTSPSYYRNPTTFLWDFQDKSLDVDGPLLKLVFGIADGAVTGEYELQIKYSYGNIFDSEGCVILMKTENGIIRILKEREDK